MRACYYGNKILLVFILSISILAGPLLCIDAFANEGSPGTPVVVVDPGHTKRSPGAISAQGTYEVEYNNNLAAKISDALSSAGYKVVLTRNANQDLTLEERTIIANTSHAIVLLSIHHDSAQPVRLEQIYREGKNVYRTRKPISGFSIFVSTKNCEFDKSYEFAVMLGEELLKLGRKPTLHHAEMIVGESRPLLDERLGIYQYDDLVILRRSNVPAVLLEVGVIVDEDDEKYVADKGNQESIVKAIVKAMHNYNSMSR